MPRQNELNCLRTLKSYWDENAHALHTNIADMPLGIQREIGRILAKEIRRVQDQELPIVNQRRFESGMN